MIAFLYNELLQNCMQAIFFFFFMIHAAYETALQYNEPTNKAQHLFR